MHRLIMVLATALAMLLSGCGLGPQDEPEGLDVRPRTRDGGSATPTDARTTTEVYFIRGDRLAPVPRPVPQIDEDIALRLLIAGPTMAEAASDIRTALSPQPLAVAGYRDPGTVYVTATPALTRISGSNQLLALGQLVWTLTEVPGITAVRIVVEGRPIEVPTDTGLSRAPVDREDYTSVSPAESSVAHGTAPPPAPPASPSDTPSPVPARPTEEARRRTTGRRRGHEPPRGTGVAAVDRPPNSKRWRRGTPAATSG